MKILLSLCIIGLGHLAYAQNQDPQNFNFGLFNNGGGSNTGGAGPNNLNPSPTPLDSSGNPSTFGTSNNNLNTIGNPPLQNGFDQNNLNGQNGFNNPNQGFSNPNQGFNNPNQAFNNPNQGFNNPNPGFNNPNQGFNGGMGNQPGMNNGFGMNGQMGMNRQFGQPGRMGMNNQFGMNPNMQFRDPTRMGNFNGNNFNRMGFDDSQRNLLQPQPMSNFQQPQQRFPSGGPGPFFPSQPQFGPMGMQMGSTFGPQFASQFPGQPSFGLFQDPFMNMFAPSPLGRRQPSPFVLQPLDSFGTSFDSRGNTLNMDDFGGSMNQQQSSMSGFAFPESYRFDQFDSFGSMTGGQSNGLGMTGQSSEFGLTDSRDGAFGKKKRK